MKKVTNANTYASPIHKAGVMKVEFILDMVPGGFHQPEDLANWIAQNPYVVSVSIDTEAA